MKPRSELTERRARGERGERGFADREDHAAGVGEDRRGVRVRRGAGSDPPVVRMIRRERSRHR